VITVFWRVCVLYCLRVTEIWKGGDVTFIDVWGVHLGMHVYGASSVVAPTRVTPTSRQRSVRSFALCC
jgi:hypothetical protein